MRGLLIVLVLVVADVSASGPTSGPCTGAQFDDYVPDATSCSHYYHCVSNAAIQLACPNGLEFNASLKICDWPSRAKCSVKSTTNNETNIVARAVSSPCQSTAPATFPNRNNCTKFIYCYQGNPLPVQCDPGFFYSAPDNGCIQAAECPVQMLPECLEDQTATFEYPGNCNKYYYCHDGELFTVQCLKGERYDDELKACILPDSTDSEGSENCTQLES